MREALADGVLTEEEQLDIKWLCERLSSEGYFKTVTADMQRLHGLVGGIASDGKVNEVELVGLRQWLDDHEHLRRTWPFDEIESLIVSVMKDQRIDADEHEQLLAFFREFTALHDDRVVDRPVVGIGQSLMGLCATQPEITFSGSRFCITGVSSRMRRTEFHALVTRLGGEPTETVTRKLDYLVIGADGNPCWAYACYGRKVEAAVNLRKAGSRLLLVHEHDFHDAVADAQ